MPFNPADLAGLVACGITVPRRPCIPLPGGGQICPPAFFDPRKFVEWILLFLSIVLAPFMPIFRLINVVVAIVNCIKAIPQSILPPNPQPIINCLAQLIVAAAEILKLIPFISLPFTLVAILDCIILFLQGMKAWVQQLLIARCQLGLLNAQFANMGALMLFLGTVMNVVNLLLSFINVGAAPTSYSAGVDPSAAGDAFDALIVPLQDVRALIPI
jgi:hypothetical protein